MVLPADVSADGVAARAMAAVVVIPCRNEASAIAQLLNAIDGQGVRPQAVILVDDASTDDTCAVVERWAAAHTLSVTIVAASGRGAGAAMNAGIARADAGIIIRLDGHCLPDPGYIQHCLETLSPADVGMAGGVWNIKPGADTPAARGIAAVLSHPLGAGGAEYRRAPARGARRPMAVDTVPFGAFRKDVWAEVGGFDESLLRNQDYDFAYRIRLTGRKVILNPAIVSAYQARPTLPALWRQYFAYGFWKIVMLRKFPKSIRLRQVLPLLLLPTLAGLVVLTFAAASAIPAMLLGAYLLLDAAGGAHAAARAGDLRLAPFAASALVTLQIAWSAGAWSSVIRGARAGRQ